MGVGNSQKKYSNKKHVRYHFDFGFDLCWFLLEENVCLVWCFGVCFGVLVFVCGFYCFSSSWFGVLFGFVGVFLWGFLVSWWVVGVFLWVFFFICLFVFNGVIALITCLVWKAYFQRIRSQRKQLLFQELYVLAPSSVLRNHAQLHLALTRIFSSLFPFPSHPAKVTW